MNKAEEILCKLFKDGDLEVWSGKHPGVGLEYSWCHLTTEEVEYLRELGAKVYDPT